MKNLDKVLDVASTKLPTAGVDCLLIGGFAVNHYGYTRNTLDVDFVIVSDRLEDVRRVMKDAGFTNIDVLDDVAFFSVPDEAPRVDFLRVDEATFRRLLASSKKTMIRGYEVRLPSLVDLIAMKVFAFSQNTARRMGKDLPDIAFLAVINSLDVESDLRPLCDRFGTPEAYELIRHQIEGLQKS